MGPQDFEYALPPERIAHAPEPDRSGSRMLVLRDTVTHAHAHELPAYLPNDALVVVNDSKVVPARLHTRRADGRAFELLVCEPADGLGPGAEVRAWVRGASRLQVGDELSVGGLIVRYVGRCAIDGRARRFAVQQGDVLQTCRTTGELPLPPYIVRPDGPNAQDHARYQTVYARSEGSIAAPTAGLHIDTDLLKALDPVRLTLHVGPGTFLPMDAPDVRKHRVGVERYSISEHAAARIEEARQAGRPIVAVGTTVTRTLETLGGRGVVRPGSGTTDLVITPGHRFSVVTHLLTNFHLPRSSLLMLVCSLGGRARVLEAYAQAVAHDYRFYSYGDCMLVCPQPSC